MYVCMYVCMKSGKEKYQSDKEFSICSNAFKSGFKFMLILSNILHISASSNTSKNIHVNVERQSKSDVVTVQ